MPYAPWPRRCRHARESGHPGAAIRCWPPWVPAFAGMTTVASRRLWRTDGYGEPTSANRRHAIRVLATRCRHARESGHPGAANPVLATLGSRLRGNDDCSEPTTMANRRLWRTDDYSEPTS